MALGSVFTRRLRARGMSVLTDEELIQILHDRFTISPYRGPDIRIATASGEADLEILSVYKSDDGKILWIDVGDEDTA